MRKISSISIIILLLLAQSTLLLAKRTASSPPKTRGNRATIAVSDMTNGVTSADLVNSILGGGVTISNIVYTGAPIASGTFTGGINAGISIDQGIILSSGGAALATGPNTSDGMTSDNLLPGDADLDLILGEGSSYDATVLEFDFVPTTLNFQFTFVMGSEEYEEYIDYHDIFAFYLNGVNIALLPGTTTPIDIGTINQTINQPYYVSNYPSPGIYDIECDGFTIPISLTATVLPNQINHIKLAVADAYDPILDTWIFINGGSFTSGNEVFITSTPPGATIYKNGQSTGLRTPEDIIQPTGTTASYSVALAPYVYSPESITIPNITSEQTINFQAGAIPSGNISIYQNGTNLMIQWDEVDGAVSYNIYAASDPYGTYDLLPEVVYDIDPDDGIVWWEFLPIDTYKFFKVTATLD